MKFAGKWKELENIILSEVTQTQKDKHVKLGKKRNDVNTINPIFQTRTLILTEVWPATQEDTNNRRGWCVSIFGSDVSIISSDVSIFVSIISSDVSIFSSDVSIISSDEKGLLGPLDHQARDTIRTELDGKAGQIAVTEEGEEIRKRQQSILGYSPARTLKRREEKNKSGPHGLTKQVLLVEELDQIRFRCVVLAVLELTL
ncbi:hypothetical protein STEG23_016252 [Scotinomys teguina]